MRSAAAALACLALTLGCTSDDPTTAPQFFPLAYTDFVAAAPLDVAAPSTVVIRDQPAWDAFWQAHAPGGGVAPAVDFSQKMLIGVFWGAGYSGCTQYVSAIDSVNLRIDGVNTTGVIEVEVGALPGLGNCLTLVFPLQMIEIDTTSTPVDFIGMVPS